jgi:ATP:ADP antiporter, AAA family
VHERDSGAAALLATLGAAVVIAHQVAAKATRDALFLSIFDVTSLPAMGTVAALFTMILVVLSSRAMAAVGPGRLVPVAFWASGLLHLAEWALAVRFSRAVAEVFYLHMAGLGAVLISGFWSLVNERFDPHTAKKRMGLIVGGGTMGALAGGLLGAVIHPVTLMLPILGAMHLLCGWTLRTLGPSATKPVAGEPGGNLREGVRVLVKLPYLRHLALLVLLGSCGGAMIDYVFKAQAKAAYSQDLLWFFAVFYTAASLFGFIVQTALTQFLLENAGLGTSAGVLPATVTFGSLGAALLPGVSSACIARGSELVIRNSLFRSGYELFYTPLPPVEKRSAKPLIDVGFEKLGDIAGYAVIMCLLSFSRIAQPAMLGIAAGVGLLGVWIARRLDRGYILALEKSLRSRAVELDPEQVEDKTTNATLRRTIAQSAVSRLSPAEHQELSHLVPPDPLLWRIISLRSGDSLIVRQALQLEAPSPSLAAHVIPLLAWDAVAEDSVQALRRAGPAITGQLIDAMLDSTQDFAVRRRVPRVLAAFASTRSVDGLLLGLDDKRFEVRFRCGRALAAVVERDSTLPIDEGRVLAAVSRELKLDRSLWESHRLLDACEEDEVLGDRANRRLEHVFTLLALRLPKEPLRISLRAIHTDDEMLRGTALEYLEGILPAPIWDQLKPLLGEKGTRERREQSREQILAELLQSHESIQVRLQELRASKLAQAGKS